MTLSELKEKISHQCDEIYILELLEIDAEMLVERFEDAIEDRFDKLVEEFSDEGAFQDPQGTED